MLSQFFRDHNPHPTGQISPLPQYVQLRAVVSYNFPSNETSVALGTSNYFALTDVATAAFLTQLYNLPLGLSVRYGSNQSVVEFYGEFYSNSDLIQFMALSGLPNATIPKSNVLGDGGNNEIDPGGEGQLDVEYIMVRMSLLCYATHMSFFACNL